VDIQNEIIGICGDVIKADIIERVKAAEAYSVIADETADISGTEQLSIGLRYFYDETNEVQEMFVGFVELNGLDAKSIVYTIDEFLTKQDLNQDKCVGALVWDLTVARRCPERTVTYKQSYAKNTL